MEPGASLVGRLGMGACADRYNPWVLALVTLSVVSGSVFVLWGVLSHNLGGLIAFGFTYGLLAGGWTSLWSGFLRYVGESGAIPAENVNDPTAPSQRTTHPCLRCSSAYYCFRAV
jgi:hypothetical protein